MKQIRSEFFSLNQLTWQHYLVLIAALAAFGSILSIKFGNFMYIQYDTYYYAAAANAFIHTFALVDNTTIPSEAIRTPQNGIIFLHYLLNLVGVHNMHTRLLVLAAMNAAMMAACAWLVTRLCLLNGIDKLASQLAGITMVISFYLYAVLLQQINDMPALFMSLLALMLMLDEQTRYRRILLFFIAAILPIFRLSGILVFASAALATLLLRDKKRTILYGILTAVSVASPALITIMLSANTSGVDKRIGSVLQGSTLSHYLSQIWHTLSLSIPEAFFRMSWFTMHFTFTNVYLGLAVSVVLLTMLSIQTWSSFVKKNRTGLIVCFSIWSLLAYFQLYHAQPTRYLIMAGVVLIIPVLKSFGSVQKQRVVAGAYIAATILISSAAIVYSPLPKDGETKRMFANVTKQFLAKVPMPLYSYFPRVSYYLTGQQSYRDIASACSASEFGNILVIAPEEQLGYYIHQYQKATGKRKPGLQYLGYDYKDYQTSRHPLPYFNYEEVTVHTYILRC